MGPTLLSAPSTPAVQPHDFGRSPVPGLSSLALPSPCGSGCGLLGLSGGSSEPAFITRPPCRCPVPSGGWFRPCDPLLPPGGSVTALMLCRSVRRFHFAEAPLLLLSSRPPSKRPADIAPFAASAVRQIQTEVILRRVFRHYCGHRCQAKTFMFSLVLSAVSRWNFKFGITVSTSQSCARKVSRASTKLRTYPQFAICTVDNPVAAVDRAGKAISAVPLRQEAQPLLSIPLRQQPQPEGIQLDEPSRIFLVIGPGVILKGHVPL